MHEPSLLAQCGAALYGPRWQSDLARDLAVSIRTMQRWAAGTVAPPPGVFAEVRRLVVERGAELSNLAKQLPKEPHS